MHLDIQFTEPPTYNERIRIDRQGLTPEQAGQAVYHGPYRDGESAAGSQGEMVSPLYPMLPDGVGDNLVQSQCYWAARLPNRGGDLMAATWEVIVSVTRASAYLTCESPRRFGSCRFRHPETGEPVEFRKIDSKFEGCPDDPDPNPMSYDVQLLPVNIALGPRAKAVTGIFTDDLVTYAQHVGFTRPAPDPDRRCPGSASEFQPFAGISDPVDFWGGELGCGQQDGFHSSCGIRCAFEPTRDGTLEMSLPGVPPHPVRPNLQVVDGSATLRRTLSGSGTGPWVWATGVDGQGSEVRWHENFSPQTSVRRARVYQRLADGREVALELPEEPRLVLTARYPGEAGPVVETWACRGTPGEDGLVVPLLGVEGVGCEGPGPDDALAVTPTYALAHLADAATPLTQPLAWQVELAAPPRPDAEVVLELEVEARLRPAALQVTTVVDLGAAETGQRRQGRALLRNVGWQVMRIDDLRLEGADAGDFAFRLPAESRPVHLPVKLDLGLPGGFSTGVRFLPEPLAWTLPPLRRVQASKLGGHLRVRTLPEGTFVQYPGGGLTVDGERLVFEDPGADFTLVAEPGEHFPVALAAHDAFVDRATPFTLLPGEAVEILVSGAPGGYGDRSGRLVVEGVPVAAPAERHQVVSTLILEGRVGAVADLFPATPQHFPTGPPSHRSFRRNVLLVSSGDTPVRRGTVALEGPGAGFFALVSNHPAEVEIDPGESELFTVEYRPACMPLPLVAPGEPWERRAVLRIETDSGDREVDLVGAYGDGCPGTAP